MRGKAGVIQTTPNKCWKTLSPALTVQRRRLWAILWYFDVTEVIFHTLF